MATLENLTKRPIVIVLDHPAFRTPDYGWRRLPMILSQESATGVRQQRIVAKSAPGTLTLPAGGKAGGLHAAIEHVPAVRSLVARGHVRVLADTVGGAPSPSDVDRPRSTSESTPAERVRRSQGEGSPRR